MTRRAPVPDAGAGRAVAAMSPWTRALTLAGQTPATRNRAVDAFRVIAILMVVCGHWLVNAITWRDGEFAFAHVLTLQPWTQYLTWLFQVMPTFFMVGGFANAASWRSAQRETVRRRAWLADRVRRLLVPTVPLVGIWAVGVAIAGAAGADADLVRAATRGAMVPIWFLAVYVVVTMLTPVTYAFWQRAGLASVAVFVLAAVAVDALGFRPGWDWLRWANYGFVWLAIHQLGYWWQRDAPGPGAGLGLVAAAAVALWLVMGPLGYSIAMVDTPSAEASNAFPPTVAMLVIGALHAGLMLAVAPTVARWLAAPRRWALVIVATSRIMTLYLWHTTALIAVLGLSLLAGGAGLDIVPATGAWWLTRPVWIAVLAVAVLPLVALFGRVESRAHGSSRRSPSPIRAAVGGALACGGLSSLALYGASLPTVPWVNPWPPAAVLVGVALATWGTRKNTGNQ